MITAYFTLFKKKKKKKKTLANKKIVVSLHLTQYVALV
jgi:hypothetical protein